MASWKYEKKQGYIYLVVRTKRGKPVPRALYKALEGAPAHNIQAWVDQWSLQNEGAKVTPAHTLFSDDTLSRQLADFLKYLKGGQRKLDEGTVDKYQRCLRSFVFPYFLEQGLKDPVTWTTTASGMLSWLQAKPTSSAYIREINNSLRGFWTWMEDEGIIPTNSPRLRLRSPPADDDEDETPLEFTVSPAQIYEFLAVCKNTDVRLLTILGYFFSLRPQESMGLRRGDFKAGTQAALFASGQAMKKTGLYEKLAVHIDRQRTKKRKLPPPKAHSKGWVSCFEQRAAQELVTILRMQGGAVDAPLFQVGNDRLFEKWRQKTKGTVLEGVTLKDLRRASVYHLGHHTGFSSEPILLMKHARHKEMETTMLYLRKPTEAKPVVLDELDLDA